MPKSFTKFAAHPKEKGRSVPASKLLFIKIILSDF